MPSRALTWRLLAGGAVLAATLASTAGGVRPAADAANAAITRISMERNCFGCPAASVLVLRRDGTATYTTTGTARSATPDSVFQGTLPVAEFERIAGFVEAQGFFRFDDTYDDPQTRDGPWVTTSVARGAQEKRVFRRDEAGPAALQAVEAAIDALRQRIVFVAERRP